MPALKKAPHHNCGVQQWNKKLLQYPVTSTQRDSIVCEGKYFQLCITIIAHNSQVFLTWISLETTSLCPESKGWIRTPKLEPYLHNRGVIADGNVLCVLVQWFIGGGSVGLEESSKGLDGVRGCMAFGSTIHTLSCHKTAASSSEYQPTSYRAHVIAGIQMWPHPKHIGAGTGSVASRKSLCGPIRAAENDAQPDTDKKTLWPLGAHPKGWCTSSLSKT